MTRQKRIGLIALTAIIAVAGLYVLISSPAQPVAKTIESSAELTSNEIAVDIEAALAERIMGSPDALITIEEFASLTCGHCATFHEDTFAKIKEAYIDTGKVRFIFTDYPLNSPALDASIVARCLPEKRYFKFIKFLFGTQKDWAYTESYRKSLKQNAKLLGGTEETLEACMNNEELRQGLVTRMQKAAEDHDIKSTPSFIINGGDVMRGAQNFAAFQKIIDKLLEESNSTE